MSHYRVNKERCLGIKSCGICLNTCPGATQEGEDGNSEIIDQEKLEKCGGASVCPMGAIKAIEGEEDSSTESGAKGHG